MSQYDEDPSVFTDYYKVEITIDRPVREVWNQFLDLSSWIVTHDIVEVSGARGTLNTITRVTPRGKDHSAPAYHYCKIIKVVPERQYLLKGYAEKGGSYGGLYFSSFDDTLFFPMDGKTKVTFELFSEVRGEPIMTARTKDPGSLSLDPSKAGITKNFENLKRIVEGR